MQRMLRIGVLVLAASSFLAGSALAGGGTGINLNWDDCTLGAAATDKIDVCTSNFGAPFVLIGSVNPPLITNMVGLEAVVDLQVDAPTLPDWWRKAAGSCRAGGMTIDFQVGFANPPFSCPEPWGGNASGALNYTEEQGGALNRARVKIIAAVPAGSPVGMDPATAPDWYLFKINIVKANTTTCVGCLTPACIVFNSALLARPAGANPGSILISNASTAQHVTWQTGGTLACPGVTPVKSKTWGQVKHLYR